jgi:hypothetical protein
MKIKEVHFCNNETEEVNILLSESGRRTFDLEIHNHKLLVLDNYGNLFSKKIAKKIFGFKEYNLAIDLKDGHIYMCRFEYSKEIDGFCLIINTINDTEESQEHYMPWEYMSEERLDILRSMKRPYSIDLPGYIWQKLFLHNIGYNSLVNQLLIRFDFHSIELEINTDGGFRTIPNWDSIFSFQEMFARNSNIVR